MLNSLNYTSLESLFHEKGGGAVFDRHKRAFVPIEEVISTKDH